MTARIADFSGQWEGRTVDDAFSLRQYLGGSETTAVFLTSYEARDAAIKLFLVDADKADAELARLQTAARLLHLNLIRIFKTGRCELDGIALLYAVMEFAEENLSQVLPERALTAIEAREMLLPTLHALEYIHRQGFVHGHLKPSNIMAVADQLKVSSDGLRKASDAAFPADDVWALGATLAEVLTQRTSETVPPNLPEPFADIVAHCLKRNAADRWTISQISNRLTQRSTAPIAPAVRRKHWAPKGVVILLVLLVVVVGGVMIQHSETGGSPAAVSPAVTPAAPKEVAEATKTTEPPPAPEPEVKTSAARAKRARKESVAETPAVVTTHAQETVAADAPAAPSTDQPMPVILPQARKSIHGKVIVNVRVSVDPSGAVTDAKLESPGASRYFTARTLAAVRQWKFQPIPVDGHNAGQQWRLHFEFQTSGMKVQPTRITP